MITQNALFYQCVILAGEGKGKQAGHTPREMSVGQGKRKQAEHTPREMSVGEGKRKQAEHAPREMIGRAEDKKNKIKNIIKEKEKQYG